MSRAPTLLFVGVTTGQSAAPRMFRRWAEILGIAGAEIIGVDLPLDASPERYRQVVEEIRQQDHLFGALITSHKLNLLRATHDLFDELTEDASLAGEVSCIYKRRRRVFGHAVDPEADIRALKLILEDQHWARYKADLLCFGAGGSAVALLTGLLTRNRRDNLPRKAVFVDRDPARLEHFEAQLKRLPPSDIDVALVHTQSAEQNDALMAHLPAGSLVVNATGMGKDRPGSPLTQAAVFPEGGIVWELNYRGELEFLHQARAQADDHFLTVADGWDLFVIGWALVFESVFETQPFGESYTRLSQAAREVR